MSSFLAENQTLNSLLCQLAGLIICRQRFFAMYDRECKRSTTINGLRAGRTVSEIVKFHKFKKMTVYWAKKSFDAHIAAGGLSKELTGKRKHHKRNSDT